MQPIEDFKVGPYTVEIHFDPEPMNPLTEYDQEGFAVYMDFGRDGGMFTPNVKEKFFHGRNWPSDEDRARVQQFLIETDGEVNGDSPVHAVNPFDEFKGWYIFPVYAYIHSGVTVRMGPFGCLWDSGQCGFIAVDPDWLEENWPELANADEAARQTKAREACEGVIKNCDDYLTGQVFGYVVKDVDGEVLESCWGFDGDQKYCEEEARAVAESLWDGATSRDDGERVEAVVRRVMDDDMGLFTALNKEFPEVSNPAEVVGEEHDLLKRALGLYVTAWSEINVKPN